MAAPARDRGRGPGIVEREGGDRKVLGRSSTSTTAGGGHAHRRFPELTRRSRGGPAARDLGGGAGHDGREAASPGGGADDAGSRRRRSLHQRRHRRRRCPASVWTTSLPMAPSPRRGILPRPSGGEAFGGELVDDAVEAGAVAAVVEAVAASGPDPAERALASLELLYMAPGGAAFVQREAPVAPVLAPPATGSARKRRGRRRGGRRGRRVPEDGRRRGCGTGPWERRGEK
ncbi:unnamed protein product, partial [Urochloa humidicola]